MKSLSLDQYLSRRRVAYTAEAQMVAQLIRDPEFRKATSWAAVDAYLTARRAPLGLRDAAKGLWRDYLRARAK